MLKSLVEKTYPSVTVDSAKETEVIKCPQAQIVTYVAVATGASTPTGIAMQVMGSLDGTNFVNVGSSVSIGANGVFSSPNVDPGYKHYKATFSRSGGSVAVVVSVLCKGDET